MCAPTLEAHANHCLTLLHYWTGRAKDKQKTSKKRRFSNDSSSIAAYNNTALYTCQYAKSYAHAVCFMIKWPFLNDQQSMSNHP